MISLASVDCTGDVGGVEASEALETGDGERGDDRRVAGGKCGGKREWGRRSNVNRVLRLRAGREIAGGPINGKGFGEGAAGGGGRLRYPEQRTDSRGDTPI